MGSHMEKLFEQVDELHKWTVAIKWALIIEVIIFFCLCGLILLRWFF